MRLASIPVSVNPTSTERDAVQTALRAVDALLGQEFDPTFLSEQGSAKTVVGQWLSLMPGREASTGQDFEQFVQDLLLQIQLGNVRSQISDAMSIFLGGILPTYTRAKVLTGMLADGRPPGEVEGYFHSIGYGSVLAFLEQQGQQAKPLAEQRLTKFVQVLTTEVQSLHREAYLQSSVALAPPVPPAVPGTTPVWGPPKTLPAIKPTLAPAAGPGAGSLLGRLAALTAFIPEIIVFVVGMGVPGNLGQSGDNYPENVWLAERQAQAAKEQKIIVAVEQTVAEAVTGASANECQPQIKENQKNGAACENDGYTLMEEVFHYARLVDPPKGKGLDGLFEKQTPQDAPNPMPKDTTAPKPGLIAFVPEANRPPHPCYDYTSEAPKAVYPKFVVFEAKNIEKTFDPTDSGGMRDEAQRRLKNTCDGMQLGDTWTEARIPSALKRSDSLSESDKATKRREILQFRYARWLFACLPGAVGTNKKVYIFIDVVTSGMATSLNAKPPKARQSRVGQPSSPNTTF